MMGNLSIISQGLLIDVVHTDGCDIVCSLISVPTEDRGVYYHKTK